MIKKIKVIQVKIKPGSGSVSPDGGITITGCGTLDCAPSCDIRIGCEEG